jgi:hypothetical protein
MESESGAAKKKAGFSIYHSHEMERPNKFLLDSTTVK